MYSHTPPTTRTQSLQGWSLSSDNGATNRQRQLFCFVLPIWRKCFHLHFIIIIRLLIRLNQIILFNLSLRGLNLTYLDIRFLRLTLQVLHYYLTFSFHLKLALLTQLPTSNERKIPPHLKINPAKFHNGGFTQDLYMHICFNFCQILVVEKQYECA